MGWSPATARLKNELEEGRLRLNDKSTVKLFGRINVFGTDQSEIGWFAVGGRHAQGTLWDYANRKLVANGIYYNWREWVDGDVYGQDDHPDLYQRATVYNIEVEDYHTYFVGQHGVWVHNFCEGLRLKNGGDIDALHLENAKLFRSEKELLHYLRDHHDELRGFAVFPSGTTDLYRTAREAGEGELLLWIQYEDKIAGRIIDLDGIRHEYAVFFDNLNPSGEDFIRVEGTELRGTTRIFIDRKWSWNLREAEEQQKLLNLLWRVTQALE